ncbi:NACHT domain-containing protein [Actinomadura algeriensis]|nr:NACHT domain-containing protein [Actinomadura algeriensis]
MLAPVIKQGALPDSAGDRGDILGALVAAATAVAVTAVWARRRTRPTPSTPSREDLERAADLLAEKVESQWKEEARLRSLSDPDPIPVAWHLIRNPRLMDHPVNIEDGADAASDAMEWHASSADIAALARRFRSTRRRRLVILGKPGMGKTSLAVQLLLHLLKTRTVGEPVPVLLPVAAWDTSAHPRLQEWLAERLLQDYPALRATEPGTQAVHALAATGRIMPVLDGLDELAPATQARVVIALNRSLGDDDQIILTSRTLEYADAVAAAGDVLTSAAVLQALPLMPVAAADHLERILPPSPGRAWTKILGDMRTDGGPRTAPSSAIAHVTATPFGLWMLRTAYITPGADPTPLTAPGRFPDRSTLERHLLDRLIPALIESRRPTVDTAEHFRPRRHHAPEDTRRHLAYLAYLLTHPHNSDGTPRTRDLAWWNLARDTITPTRFRMRAGVLIGIVAGVLCGLTATLLEGPFYGLAFLITCAPLVGLFACFAVGYPTNSWLHDQPAFADLQIRDRHIRLIHELKYVLTAGLLAGLMIGSVITFADGFALGVTAAITLGLVPGAAAGLVHAVEMPTSTEEASTPLSSWRADRRWNITKFIGLGLTFGLMSGITAGLADNLSIGLTVGVTVAFPSGILLGRHHAWMAYLIAVRRLARRGCVPRDLMHFLDDAHRLGLLRAVGPVYQFRHAELQDHLAAAYRPTPRQRRVR